MRWWASRSRRQLRMDRGRKTVIAYAHEAQAPALKEVLEREVPGQFRIVRHRIATSGPASAAGTCRTSTATGKRMWRSQKKNASAHAVSAVDAERGKNMPTASHSNCWRALRAGTARPIFLFCLNKSRSAESTRRIWRNCETDFCGTDR